MKTTELVLVCLTAAMLAPRGAEALNCKSCLYAEVDDEDVDASTLKDVLDDLGLEVKCKNPSSLPSTQCPSGSQCIRLEYSATVELSDGDSVSMNTVYRNCYQGDNSGEGCVDVNDDDDVPGLAGDMVTSLELAGYDVTDFEGSACVCNKNNCNKDDAGGDDEGGAAAVGMTFLTFVAVIAGGQMCM